MYIGSKVSGTVDLGDMELFEVNGMYIGSKAFRTVNLE